MTKMTGHIFNNGDIINFNSGNITINADSQIHLQNGSHTYNWANAIIAINGTMSVDETGQYLGYFNSTLNISSTGTVDNNVQDPTLFTVSPTSTFNQNGTLNGPQPVSAEPH